MTKETLQEKENRIYRMYKKDLEKLGTENGQIRMNVIEYVCRCPKIDPYKMAMDLLGSGFKIVFDDSSISKAENDRKRRRVEKLTA